MFSWKTPIDRAPIAILTLGLGLLVACGEESSTEPESEPCRPAEGEALPDLVPIAVPTGPHNDQHCTGSYSAPEFTLAIANVGGPVTCLPVAVSVSLYDGQSFIWPVKTWNNFTRDEVWETNVLYYNIAPIPVDFTCDMPEGEYHWSLWVDPENRVAESDETNNRLTSTTSFRITH
jgi:hypothetical protein